MFFKIYYIIFYFVSETNAVVATGKKETLDRANSYSIIIKLRLSSSLILHLFHHFPFLDSKFPSSERQINRS